MCRGPLIWYVYVSTLPPYPVSPSRIRVDSRGSNSEKSTLQLLFPVLPPFYFWGKSTDDPPPHQLISVSAFTLASFLLTSVLHFNRTLKPIYNVYINSFLSLLWCVGFALLSWNLSITLVHRCSIENWSTEAGVMVCRIYKALEAFATLGMYVYFPPPTPHQTHLSPLFFFRLALSNLCSLALTSASRFLAASMLNVPTTQVLHPAHPRP